MPYHTLVRASAQVVGARTVFWHSWHGDRLGRSSETATTCGVDDDVGCGEEYFDRNEALEAVGLRE
ncbi:MAG: hypothetical protein QOJ55_1560 [Solirubrobacteraceae bacterium]|nr:hypothetical protein [Solirubrobacteraceae bacterium]